MGEGRLDPERGRDGCDKKRARRPAAEPHRRNLPADHESREIGHGAHELAPQNDTGSSVYRRRDVAVDSKCCEHEECYDKRGPYAADSLSYQRNHWDEQYGGGVDPDKLDAQRKPANLV